MRASARSSESTRASGTTTPSFATVEVEVRRPPRGGRAQCRYGRSSSATTSSRSSARRRPLPRGRRGSPRAGPGSGRRDRDGLHEHAARRRRMHGDVVDVPARAVLERGPCRQPDRRLDAQLIAERGLERRPRRAALAVRIAAPGRAPTAISVPLAVDRERAALEHERHDDALDPSVRARAARRTARARSRSPIPQPSKRKSTATSRPPRRCTKTGATSRNHESPKSSATTSTSGAAVAPPPPPSKPGPATTSSGSSRATAPRDEAVVDLRRGDGAASTRGRRPASRSDTGRGAPTRPHPRRHGADVTR